MGREIQLLGALYTITEKRSRIPINSRWHHLYHFGNESRGGNVGS